MTSFIGNASGGTAGVGTFAADNNRLLSREYSGHEYVWVSWNHVINNEGYANSWWPRNKLDASGDEWFESYSYALPEQTRGRNSRFAVIGVTRDVYGTVVGGVTVKLFKTADGSYPGTKDLLLHESTSDPNTGVFTLMTPYYPDTHYIVAYKTGSPDIEGTSVNTLIGA